MYISKNFITFAADLGAKALRTRICMHATDLEHMGKLAFILNFILAVYPTDATENRRHVHVIHKGKKRKKTHRGNTVAKFWIERDGVKCIEIDWSNLTAQENADIINAIDKNWETINQQIDKVFAGNKVTILTLDK